MNIFLEIKKKDHAKEECVTILSNIIKTLQWGSGYTDAQVLKMIRDSEEEIKKQLRLAKGLP